MSSKGYALRRYHLTSEAYDNLSKKCELCGTYADLAIDHNHETGVVRGVLCIPCNFKVGAIESTPNFNIWYALLKHYLER